MAVVEMEAALPMAAADNEGLTMFKTIIISIIACKSILACSNIEPERFFQNHIREIVIELDEGKLTFTGQSDSNGVKIISCSKRGACQDDLKIEKNVLRLINKKDQGGCVCDYHIVAPSNTFINITSGKSDITLSDMTGFLNVAMGQGNIEGNSLLKGIDIKLGQGDVTLNNHNAPTFLSIGQGNVSISYPEIPKSPTDIEISVGMGNIRLNIPEASRVHYGSKVFLRPPAFSHCPDTYNFRILNMTVAPLFGKIIMSKI